MVVSWNYAKSSSNNKLAMLLRLGYGVGQGCLIQMSILRYGHELDTYAAVQGLGMSI